MSRARPRFFGRLMPWIGSLIIIIGATQAGLTLSKSETVDMRTLGTGLLVCGGGLSLVARRLKLSPALFAFVGGALAISWVIVQAARS